MRSWGEPSVYITSIKIKNLRCFEDAELALQYAGREQTPAPQLPNINLLLGNNGGGKSTVLKAIALAALSPVIVQSGLLPYRLVRRAPDEQIAQATVMGEMLLHAQDLGVKKLAQPRVEALALDILRSGNSELLKSAQEPTFTSQALNTDGASLWEKMYDDGSPAFLVLGYGASRRIEDAEKLDESARRKSRRLRYERVAGLFETHITLTPLVSWLPRFKSENPGRHKQVVNLLDQLLPDGANFTGQMENGEYLFEVNGLTAPFAALSDGYRAYIGWIADVLYHINKGAPSGAKLVETYGIVLVDEIDLHLHPEWQRSVIATISATLPNLQFVFTTHSPIIAASLNRENIFVMEPTGDGASIVKQYDERIYGLTAEQALTSSYFNLKTTRAAGFVEEMKDLSVKAGRGDLNSALAFMEKLASPALDPQAAAPSNAVAVAAAKSRLAKTSKATTRKSAKAKRGANPKGRK